MNLYRVIPGPPESFPSETPQQRAVIGATLVPPHTPWVRAIMVANSAGETTGQSGTSTGLSRGADRMLLNLYRESADVVIVGATTVRKERVPTPRAAVLAIVSHSGDLRDHKVDLRDRAQVVVVTSPTGAPRVASDFSEIPHHTVVLDTDPPFSAHDILVTLSGTCSTEQVLIEGGRVLWETFAVVTDELALAVTPPPLNHHGGIPDWWPTDTSAWALHSLMSDDEKMLYYRYITHIRGESSGHESPASHSVKK